MHKWIGDAFTSDVALQLLRQYGNKDEVRRHRGRDHHRRLRARTVRTTMRTLLPMEPAEAEE
jgi:hypothetical protein